MEKSKEVSMEPDKSTDEFINEVIQKAQGKLKTPLNEDENHKLHSIIKRMVEENISLKESMGLTQQFIESLYGTAYQMYKSGKYKDSGALFRLLTLTEPNDTRFTMGLGASKQMHKDYDEAIIAYHTCAYQDLTNPIPYFYLSECYRQKNNNHAALYSLYQSILRIQRNPLYLPLLEKTLLLAENLQKELGQEEDELLRKHNIDPEEYRKSKKLAQEAAQKEGLATAEADFPPTPTQNKTLFVGDQ